MVGAAVKVTAVPAHTLPVGDGDAEISTDGVIAGFTDMVSALDVATEGLAQLEFEVSTQLTISLFDKVVVVYERLL